MQYHQETGTEGPTSGASQTVQKGSSGASQTVAGGAVLATGTEEQRGVQQPKTSAADVKQEVGFGWEGGHGVKTELHNAIVAWLLA